LWQPIVQPGCEEGQKNKNLSTLNCGSVSVIYEYIKSDVFVLENQFDTNQLFTQEGAPENGNFVIFCLWRAYENKQ